MSDRYDDQEDDDDEELNHTYAEEEDLDAEIDSAEQLREFGKAYETRNSQYDEIFERNPIELSDVQKLSAIIAKPDGAQSVKEALIYSAWTPKFLDNLIQFNDSHADLSADAAEKVNAFISFTILARINAAIASGNPAMLEDCFNQLNKILEKNSNLAEKLRVYRSPNGEMLEDILMKLNLETHIVKLKQSGQITDLSTESLKTQAILARLQPMRDFSRKLKLGKEQREKYFKQVYDRIQDIHVEKYGDQGKLEAARKHILKVTVGTYASMYDSDGSMTDEWYERYMREIISGQLGKKSKKSQLLSVKSAEDSVVAGGEYEEHLLDTKKKLDAALAKNNATGVIAGVEVPALSVESGEMPTSIIKGSGGHYAITMRGGRGRNSAPFLVSQGNYGDITMAADPLFGFAIANKKEVPTNNADPKNPVQKWLVTRAEMQAKTGPRYKGMRNKFADSSSFKEWLHEATLTIAMGKAIAYMHRDKKKPKVANVPIGVRDRFQDILSETKVKKAYTLQKFISGEELAASIKDENAKFDLAAYEKWLRSKKDELGYEEKLARYLKATTKARVALLLADDEYNKRLHFSDTDELPLQAVATYERWLVKEDDAKKLDFASRSPFNRLLMLLADTNYKASLDPEQVKSLVALVEQDIAKRLAKAVSVTKGLVRFHVAGYVHGDVKGRNIMESAGNDDPIDFGTSGRARSDGTSQNPIDTFMGMTANLIPPEAIAGKVEHGKRTFHPTFASDVYQMAAVCFNYSNTNAFARVNMERFICNPKLMGFASGGPGLTLFHEYLNKEQSEHNAVVQQECKQAYIDLITGVIKITPRLPVKGSKNTSGVVAVSDAIEWGITPPQTREVTIFLKKLAAIIGKTNKPKLPPIANIKRNIEAYISQVKTRAALISKRGGRDGLTPTINTGTKTDRFGHEVPNVIDEENIGAVAANMGLKEQVLKGYTRTPASDDEGSGFELYDAIKLLAELQPAKYGELLLRIQALMQSTMTKAEELRISAKQFNTEMAGIARRFEILQNPAGKLANLDGKRKELAKRVEEIKADPNAYADFTKFLTKDNLLKELLENILDDSVNDQKLIQDLKVVLKGLDEEVRAPILTMLGTENPENNIFENLINNGKIKLATELFDFVQPENYEVWQAVIYAAASNGEYDFILHLQELNDDIEWDKIFLEEISAGQNSVLDFCLAQNNVKAFAKFLPLIKKRMRIDDLNFKDLLSDIALNANDSTFITAVIEETGLKETAFINQYFPQAASSGMSCLAQYFLCDVEFAKKIIAHLTGDNIGLFFKVMGAGDSESSVTQMSTAMLAFVGNNTEIMKAVFDFALANDQIANLKYERADGVTVTFFDHILANNNVAMFEYVRDKLKSKPKYFADLLSEDKSGNNCMLGLIMSADSTFLDDNQEIFVSCVDALSAITNEEVQREFYLKTLGARAFVKAFSLGKLDIVHKLNTKYAALGIRDVIFKKLFGLDSDGETNPEFAKIKQKFLNLQPFNVLLAEHGKKDLELLRTLFDVAKSAGNSVCMDSIVARLTEEDSSFFANEQELGSSEFLYDMLTDANTSTDSANKILLHRSDGGNSFVTRLLQQPLLAMKAKEKEDAIEALKAKFEAAKVEFSKVKDLHSAARESVNKQTRIHKKAEENHLAEERKLQALHDGREAEKKIIDKRKFDDKIEAQEKVVKEAEAKKVAAEKAVAKALSALRSRAMEKDEKADALQRLEDGLDAVSLELSALHKEAQQFTSAKLSRDLLLRIVGQDKENEKKQAAIATVYDKLSLANKPMEALFMLLEVIKFSHQSPEYAEFHTEWLQAKLKKTIRNLIANKARYEDIYGDGIVDGMFKEVFAIYTSNNSCADPIPWQELARGTLDLEALNQQLQDAKSFVNRLVHQIRKIEDIADNGFISEVQAWEQALLTLSMNDMTLKNISREEVAIVKEKIKNLQVISNPAKSIAQLLQNDLANASLEQIIECIKTEKAKVMAAHAGADILKIFKEIASANADYNFAKALKDYATNHNQHTTNVILHTAVDDPLREIMFAQIQHGLPYPAAVVRDLDLLQKKFIALVQERIAILR